MTADAECTLDLRRTTWIYPPGAVAARALIQHRTAIGLPTTLQVPQSADALTYLGRIDFFRALPETVRVEGEIAHLDEHARHESETFTEIVRVHPGGIQQLLNVLGMFLQQHTPILFQKIYRATDELLSNIGRHASLGLVSPAYGCCQIQIYANRVELSFADLGIGYLRSLQSNPRHRDVQTSEEALRGIIQHGLSRHHRTDETHGGGLRAIAQMARSLGGDLRIITYDGEVWERRGRRAYSTATPAFPGTITVMLIPVSRRA